MMTWFRTRRRAMQESALIMLAAAFIFLTPANVRADDEIYMMCDDCGQMSIFACAFGRLWAEGGCCGSSGGATWCIDGGWNVICPAGYDCRCDGFDSSSGSCQRIHG